MTPEQISFLQLEYPALRAEIDALLATNRELPQYALLVSAVLWAWLLTQRTTKIIPAHVCFIAPVITLVLWIRSGFICKKFQLIGEYLASVQYALLPKGFGWEQTLLNTPGNFWNSNFGDGMLWFIIVLTNSITAWYYWKTDNKHSLINVAPSQQGILTPPY